MTTADIVINMAYIALVGAAFVRPIMVLRALLLTAASFFIVFGVIADIPSMIVWNVLIGSLHIKALREHFQSRREITLSREARRIHRAIFPQLSTFDFYALWSVGENTTYNGTALATGGNSQKTLAVILEGTVEIHQNRLVVNRLHAGSLVGELSYVSGQPAAADALAVGTVRVREWDQQRLRLVAATNPRADKALHEAISLDLRAKLVR